jgi:hypothetical protein
VSEDIHAEARERYERAAATGGGNVVEVNEDDRFVTLCANCEMPVTSYGRHARRPPTGWTHWGFWQGVRCVSRLCGAQPGRGLSLDDYLAWLDERLATRA